MHIKQDRIGVFFINRQAINERPWEVTRIMSQCVIVRAEMEYVNDCIRYTAISRHFDVLERAKIAPYYTWCELEDGSLTAIKD